MRSPGFAKDRTTWDTHDVRNTPGQRPTLPRFPRRRRRWQRNSLVVLRTAGLAAGQFVGGFALAFASLAVADTVTTDPTVHQLVAVGLIIGAALMAWGVWVAHRSTRRSHRNLSSGRQGSDLSNRGLSRRFRRG